MREIKFRLLLNGKVVGYEKWYPGAGERAEAQWLYSDDGKYWNPAKIGHTQKDQFTGLLDKNGKEIFDGDILQVVGGYEEGECESFQVVHWCAETLQWIVKCVQHKDVTMLYELDESIVIGNIHENPELIAGK